MFINKSISAMEADLFQGSLDLRTKTCKLSNEFFSEIITATINKEMYGIEPEEKDYET